MNKSELLTALKQANQFDTNSRTDLWIKAFDLYNQSNPGFKMKMGCGGCYTKVREWLRS